MKEAVVRPVLEHDPEAVLVCDADTGRILETNACFTRYFGYDLLRDGPLDLFGLSVDPSENVGALLATARKNGFLSLQQGEVRHRNGTRLQVERSASVINAPGGKKLVMTLRDVSESVRREHELTRDRQLAGRVQKALLKLPEPSEYLSISTVYEPCSYVGGDLYFMDWRYDGNLLRGYLVDATGHGLATALHTSAMHVLLREVNDLDLPLSDQMAWLNQRVGQYFDEGTFAGALAFEIDLQCRRLRWVCAGIPEIRVATRALRGLIVRSGSYLGINVEEQFETHTIPFAVGDSFYFLTNGLADRLGFLTDLAQDRYSEMVGLLTALSKAEDIQDDSTAICIEVKSLPQHLFRQDGWPRILNFNRYGDYQRFKVEITKIVAEVTGKSHSLEEVAVHEALANALECRDGMARQHRALIRFNKVGNRLIVRVKSTRMGFAGNAILRRLKSHPEDMFCFGEDASMGRGIPIMLTIAQRMTYNSEGTEVLLAWKLNEK